MARAHTYSIAPATEPTAQLDMIIRLRFDLIVLHHHHNRESVHFALGTIAVDIC